MSANPWRLRPALTLPVLTLLALLACVIFMTINARGNWGFVLPFRGTKLLALVLIAYAIAVSTVLFQTVTNNRILTPSIMGFDALYVLIQTILVFMAGSSVGLLDPGVKFALETLAMVTFATALNLWLFSGRVRSLHLMVLVGIIFGVLFRSIANFLQRLIDPNAFVVLQDSMFASFNTFDRDLMGIAALTIIVSSLLGLKLLHTLDVLALGRETAVNLGVAHRRTVMFILMLVAVLVSVSTALVGPVTFFGLLVANLAYVLIGSHKHVFILPAAILLAIISLVGGQVIVEQVFGLNTSLSIIIEFIGGLVFIFLILKGATR